MHSTPLDNAGSSVTVSFQPVGRSIETECGITLLEAARKAGVGLSAICGGEKSCGSCIVRLDPEASVSPVTENEKRILLKKNLKEGYRLACRTRILGPLVVDIPAETLTAPQRTQIEGQETSAVLKPNIVVTPVDLPLKIHLQELTTDRLLSCSGKPITTEPKPLTDSAACRLSRLIDSGHTTAKAVLRNSEIIGFYEKTAVIAGIAVDIGTTKIAAYLVNMETGKTLAGKGIMNPQIAYGEDVMARVAYIGREAAGAQTLQEIVIEALNRLIGDLCHGAGCPADDSRSGLIVDRTQIVDAVVVGNTVMHHLFFALPAIQLGAAPYSPNLISSVTRRAHTLSLDIAPEADIYSLPLIAGFVGSDHVSMLLASGITNETETTLYVDIGTNTEITLFSRDRMISCSTASGPAFEGAHIRHGMRAAEGAIERVRIEGNKVYYQTINHAKPTGICGSGMIDVVAQMVLHGIVGKTGILDRSHELVETGENGTCVIIAPSTETAYERDIVISRKDVSEIQLAKGAIRAGIELLMREMETGAEEVKKIVMAGAFGSYIDMNSAVIIGLLPTFQNGHIRQVGNAAGTGAKLSLVSLDKRTEAEDLALNIEYLELSTHPGFTPAFTQAMMFE